jgi:hypothetical protein
MEVGWAFGGAEIGFVVGVGLEAYHLECWWENHWECHLECCWTCRWMGMDD